MSRHQQEFILNKYLDSFGNVNHMKNREEMVQPGPLKEPKYGNHIQTPVTVVTKAPINCPALFPSIHPLPSQASGIANTFVSQYNGATRANLFL